MNAPLLELRELHVWFDLEGGGTLHAVRGTSLTLSAGDRFGLVGESGSGKTTTALAMMGLLPAAATVAGEVLLNGVNVLTDGEESARPHRWKDIAIVFQGAMNAFSPVQPIGEQIAEPMRHHEIAEGREAHKRAGDLLELVGIHRDRASRYPHEFSGGMRQRAAIAMALACEPMVLLADEPTTALDVMVQAQILEVLVRLTGELGLGLILVTHDLSVVAQVCQRAGVMYAGRIVEAGSTDALYHQPAHPYTRLLFASTPDLDGDRPVASIPGSPPSLDREPDGCSFAPRCDRAFEPCGASAPAAIVVAEAHDVECHLHDPVRART
jgi:peptide/nickel transport system ATP-binding protein